MSLLIYIANSEYMVYPVDSNTELLLHMDGNNDENTFTDDSAATLTITPNNNTVTKTTVKKFGTASGYFDGDGDWLDVQDSVTFAWGTGDFTYECWINTTVKTADTYYRRIFVNDGPTGNANGNPQMAIHTSGVINCWSNTGSLDFNGTTDVADGVWHHIAMVRESGVVKLYVDGTFENSQAYSENVSESPSAIRIGSYGAGGGDFQGYIDEFAVSSVARFTDNFTPSNVPYN